MVRASVCFLMLLSRVWIQFGESGFILKKFPLNLNQPKKIKVKQSRTKKRVYDDMMVKLQSVQFLIYFNGTRIDVGDA